MSESIDSIIEKARMLSESIKRHDSTARYNENLARMNADRDSQELYARLVSIGKEINDRMARGESAVSTVTSEYEILKRELEDNALVREYIRSQQEYLGLLKKVIDRIKNPGD